MKFDLHTHPIPKSGFLEKLVDRCIKVGMSNIAVTDVGDERYAFFRDYIEQKRLSPKYNSRLTDRGFRIGIEKQPLAIKFIRGQEVLTKDGHLLTVGAVQKIPDNTSLEDALKRARDYDAIIIADHPYVQKEAWGGMGEENLVKYLEYFDGIEWNAQSIDAVPKWFPEWHRFLKFGKQAQANEKAEKFAEKYGLPLIADSDAHFTNILGIGGSLNQIGLSYIESFFNYTDDFLFIHRLREMIENKKYTNIKNNINRRGFFRWCIPLLLKQLFTGKNGYKKSEQTDNA